MTIAADFEAFRPYLAAYRMHSNGMAACRDVVARMARVAFAAAAREFLIYVIGGYADASSEYDVEIAASFYAETADTAMLAGRIGTLENMIGTGRTDSDIADFLVMVVAGE